MTDKRFGTSIVCGKFYPPHKGHHYLIDTACMDSNQVTVLLCWRSDESISVEERMKCLQEEHPTVTILPIPCIPKDDDSIGWAKYTLDVLGYVPDAVYSSEDYGEPYAKAMGCSHVMVDKARTIVPCSGTMIRNDPYKYFDYLSPSMKAHYALRIVIIGAESTGTTTLAESLAKHYNTVCVPEFGRTYTRWKYERDQKNWYVSEFEHIASKQNELEDQYARNANKVLICDTDSFATILWQQRYCKNTTEAVRKLGCGRNTFYIVTNCDIPFVQDEDGLRDGEDIRHSMHGDFISALNFYDKEYIVASGKHEQRMKDSIKFIDNILANIVSDEPQYCKHLSWSASTVRGVGPYYCGIGRFSSMKWCCRKNNLCKYREEKE